MGTLTIGELSKVVGLTPPAIRYYEEIGLIPEPPRSQSGYRLYCEEDARRLRFIQRAKMLSLTLDEIKEMVSCAVDGRCTTLQNELLTLLQKKLEQTRRRISELEEFGQELERFCNDLSANVSPDVAKAVAAPEFCDCLGENSLALLKVPRSNTASKFLIDVSGPELTGNPYKKGGTQMADKPQKDTKRDAKDCGCGCVSKKK